MKDSVLNILKIALMSQVSKKLDNLHIDNNAIDADCVLTYVAETQTLKLETKLEECSIYKVECQYHVIPDNTDIAVMFEHTRAMLSFDIPQTSVATLTSFDVALKHNFDICVIHIKNPSANFTYTSSKNDFVMDIIKEYTISIIDGYIHTIASSKFSVIYDDDKEFTDTSDKIELDTSAARFRMRFVNDVGNDVITSFIPIFNADNLNVYYDNITSWNYNEPK